MAQAAQVGAGPLRWSEPKRQVVVSRAFGELRSLPRHLLLGELQHAVLMELSKAAQCKFQGLAQAAKHTRLGNRLAAKCRLVDDSHHLLEHLTPESCQTFLDEVTRAIDDSVGHSHSQSSGVVVESGTRDEEAGRTTGAVLLGDLCGGADCTSPGAHGGSCESTRADGATSEYSSHSSSPVLSSICHASEEPIELEPDALSLWFSDSALTMGTCCTRAEPPRMGSRIGSGKGKGEFRFEDSRVAASLDADALDSYEEALLAEDVAKSDEGDDSCSGQLLFEVNGAKIGAWEAAAIHRSHNLLIDVWAHWTVEVSLVQKRKQEQLMRVRVASPMTTDVVSVDASEQFGRPHVDRFGSGTQAHARGWADLEDSDTEDELFAVGVSQLQKASEAATDGTGKRQSKAKKKGRRRCFE